jgi:N-acylneuraminate cytidylyltransferase
VPFRRDTALATDTATSIDVVLDALDRVAGHDIVVLLQPTSPLRTAADIDGLLARMHAASAPACVSVREAQDHPYWTYRIQPDGELAPFVPRTTAVSRRQDLPAAWCLNGAIYAARTDWLRQHHSFVGPGTIGFEMPVERSLDIDTPQDLERLKAIMDNTKLARS